MWVSQPRNRYKHLVHISNASVKDIAESFQNGFLIDSVGFLINETENSIELVSSYMFTESACHSNKFLTVNRFHKYTRRWESANFFPKKYRNFYGCSLKSGMQYLKRGAQKVDEKIYIELSRVLNFKIEYKLMEKDKLIKSFIKNQLDLVIESVYLGIGKNYIAGIPYAIDRATFTVPPGELFQTSKNVPDV